MLLLGKKIGKETRGPSALFLTVRFITNILIQISSKKDIFRAYPFGLFPLKTEERMWRNHDLASPNVSPKMAMVIFQILCSLPKP
jgi:hypothetical protein